MLLLAVFMVAPALAQDEPAEADTPSLLLFTQYPSQVVGIGESVTLDLNVRAGQHPELVDLAVQNLPENWTANFRGNGRIVESVYAEPEVAAPVELRIEPPADVAPGVYEFAVIARGDGVESELPIELTVQEKVPARLAFSADLPVLRGRPSTTFRYNLTLTNEGDEDLAVDLSAQAPPFFTVVFKSSGQEVTNIPVEANSEKRLNVEVDPLLSIIPAGAYPITVLAQGGEAETAIELVAEVVGEAALNLTTPDERLSGEAEIGAQTPVTLVVQNTGSAPAVSIEMSASSPSGWSVTFEPEMIEQIEPGAQAQVTARVQPSDKAIAGDYEITFRAQPEGGATESVEYRVTVRTSTVWGIAGVALIAIAVGVVGLAVSRFGRR
jgi:uncharacterized membrane protein